MKIEIGSYLAIELKTKYLSLALYLKINLPWERKVKLLRLLKTWLFFIIEIFPI